MLWKNPDSACSYFPQDFHNYVNTGLSTFCDASTSSLSFYGHRSAKLGKGTYFAA